MYKKMGKLVLCTMASLLLLAVILAAGCAPKEQAPVAPTEEPTREDVLNDYTICNFGDYSGPYAQNGPRYEHAQRIVYGWWNDTKGKEIGVRLVFKTYDHKYEPATQTTLYNKAKVSEEPLAILTHGGGCAIALSELLIEDKIPGMNICGGYGFMNKAHGWLFTPSSTYDHHMAAVTDYWLDNWTESRPMRVAMALASNVAAKDLYEGIENYFASREDGIDFVATEWLPQGTTEALAPVKRLVADNPDYIWSLSDIPSEAAVITALHDLGLGEEIPCVHPQYAGLELLAEVLPRDMLEGEWEGNCFDCTNLEVEGAKIFSANKDKYAPKAEYTADVAQGMVSAFIVCDAVERATAKVGADKLTNQAIYDELDAGTFDGRGITKEIQFDPLNRLAGVSYGIGFQVQNGKTVAATPWVKIPSIKPWGIRE
jgi:branched-chain amino acid transport system substrate-binding protein